MVYFRVTAGEMRTKYPKLCHTLYFCLIWESLRLSTLSTVDTLFMFFGILGGDETLQLMPSYLHAMVVQ